MNTKTTSTRLFKSDFAERFSHVHHTTPFFIYIPVILISFYLGTRYFNIASMLGLYLGGLFFWTLFEYAMHRFLFHYRPSSKWGKRLLYILHEVHHEYPRETDRLVMPPVTSIPLAIGLFLCFHWLIAEMSFGFYAGFVTGYLYYEFVHYSVHHSKKKVAWFEWQRKNHLRHHFKDEQRQYGVSSPLWDFVFRTY